MNQSDSKRLDGKVPLSEAVPETSPPTQEQLRLIRESIDPDGMRKREFR